MRKLLPLFLVLAMACNQEAKQPVTYAASVATSTWKTITGKEWYFTKDRPIPVKPGDTVLVGAEYNEISLNDVNGLPGKPIVFIRVGTMARVGKTHYGNPMVVQRCSYLVFDNFEVGPDNPTDTTFAAQGWNIQSSHNIEIRNFILKNANVGFFTNPATGHYPNIWIHDGVVKNINDKKHTSFDEAFYIGKTSGQSPDVNSFENLIIENITMQDIGGDGIQIANGKNVIVRNNKAYRVGTNKINDQWFVYFNGGGCSGTWENNYAEDCTGTPFQILGTGRVVYRNNTAVRCATGLNQDGFYIRQSFPTLSVGMFGNKIDGKNRSWVTNASNVVIDSSGNIFGIAPVPPVDPCSKELATARAEIAKLQSENEALKKWKSETQAFVNRP